jgi:hypothetical protein
MARESKRKRDERRFGRPERLADKVFELKWHPPFECDRSEINPDTDEWYLAACRCAIEIAGCPIFVADNVANYVLSQADNNLAWADLPPLSFPFDRFFIEMAATPSFAARFLPDDGRFPPRWGIYFDVMDIDNFMDIGGQVAATLARDGGLESASHMAVATVVTERLNGIVGPIEHSFTPLRERSTIVGGPSSILLFAERYKDRSTPRLDGVRHYLHILKFPAFMALAFMNCKRGVTFRDIDPPPDVNRERRKAGLKPFLRYRTIEIDGMKETLRTEGNIETNGLKKALHICRGSFARYTDSFMGRPLAEPMTVWRPAHVRGSANEGVVFSDYNVKAPTEA